MPSLRPPISASISGADPHQIHSIRGNALAPFSSITISGVARLERGA